MLRSATGQWVHLGKVHQESVIPVRLVATREQMVIGPLVTMQRVHSRPSSSAEAAGGCLIDTGLAGIITHDAGVWLRIPRSRETEQR